jgi:hypothetical protein
MKRGQFRLYVHPENGGTHTRWRLCGSLVTTLPRRQFRWLFRILWFWSGWPVELVLPAGAGTAEWLAWWSDMVALVPARHLHVRFVLPPLALVGKSHER